MRELWTRAVRKTGTTYTLALDEEAHLYWVTCEHGSRMSARTRGRAMDYAKTCDTWCDGCADGEPDVRPQRPARLVHAGTKIVDAETGGAIAEVRTPQELHDAVLRNWLSFEIEEPTLPDGGAADPRWFDRARCQGMPGRIFFEGAWNATADNNRGRRSKGFQAARAVCLTCPVRWECREDARTLPLALRQGVRAGYDPREIDAG